MKLILVVEDNQAIQAVIKATLEGRAEYHFANTLSEASNLLVKHWAKLYAVLVSKGVPSGSEPREMTPEEWARHVKKITRAAGFFPLFIVFSGDPAAHHNWRILLRALHVYV